MTATETARNPGGGCGPTTDDAAILPSGADTRPDHGPQCFVPEFDRARAQARSRRLSRDDHRVTVNAFDRALESMGAPPPRRYPSTAGIAVPREERHSAWRLLRWGGFSSDAATSLVAEPPPAPLVEGPSWALIDYNTRVEMAVVLNKSGRFAQHLINAALGVRLRRGAQ